jgi:hypothetical protein
VNVAVDQAGEDSEVGEVGDFGVGGQVGGVADGADQAAGAVFEEQRGAAGTQRRDHAVRDECLCHNSYYPLRKPRSLRWIFARHQ